MQHSEIEINKSQVLRNVHTLLLNQILATPPLAHMRKCHFVFCGDIYGSMFQKYRRACNRSQLTSASYHI